MTAKQQLDRIFKDIVDTTDELRTSRRLKALGSFTIDMIQKRTGKEGKGVKRSGGNLRKLKRLSKLYIAFRKRHKKKYRFPKAPTKSHLTFSGQMLASLRTKIPRKGNVVIAPTGSRDGGGPSNEQVAIYVQAQGRPFLFLGRAEQTKLVTYYQKTFDNVVKRKKNLR